MSYNKKVWKSGDRITKEALNNMENGIEAAHQNSGGTGSAAIVDNLNSDSSTSALSAKQGKALNNKIPTKSIVEGGKLYLAKEDGTKLDSGTELPAGGSTIEVVNNRHAKKLYLSYLEQVQNAENEAKEQERIAEEQKVKEEEERRKKSPQLTEEGKTNMANIYKSDTKRVFLTFDDGPSSNVTPMVLDTLKAENIKATFFLLGSRVELSPEIVKREDIEKIPLMPPKIKEKFVEDIKNRKI